jgi:hypothetical protein
MVGLLWIWDGSTSCPVRKHQRRAIEVEPPLLPTGGVIGGYKVDVLRLHVPAQHEADTPHDLGLPRLLEL